MSLLINKPGILTTIQDLGRIGARSFGINPSGVMDSAAARILNVMLGNEESAGVIEMYYPAPEIEFDNDTVFAIGGAEFGAAIDGVSIPNWTASIGRKNGVLKFTEKRSGNCAYIAVEGGVQADLWLDSASTNLMAGVGGLSGRRLETRDRIECGIRSLEVRPIRVGSSVLPHYSRFPTVRILAGNEFELLTAASERIFLNDGFTLTKDCNRMGFRLNGKPLHLLNTSEMVSSAVSFGTIQLLPDGQLIVLMADHQTSGGYPRIGNVIPVDLPILAQCGPGDGISFQMVSIEEAERLTIQFETELSFLRVGCRLQKQNAEG